MGQRGCSAGRDALIHAHTHWAGPPRHHHRAGPACCVKHRSASGCDGCCGRSVGADHDELVAAARDQLDSPPHEATAVVGLAGPRIVAVERTDLADGEGPVLAAIQAVLQHGDAAALVVFTDRRPPQWVIQPCHLFRDVAVVTNRARPSQGGESL